MEQGQTQEQTQEQTLDPVAKAKADLAAAKQAAADAKAAAKAAREAEKAKKEEAANLRKAEAQRKKDEREAAKAKREADREAKKAEREAKKANKTPRSHTHVQFVEGGNSEPTALSTRGLVFRKLKELGTEQPVAIADLKKAVGEILGGEVELKPFLAKLVMHKHAVFSTPTPVVEETTAEETAAEETAAEETAE